MFAGYRLLRGPQEEMPPMKEGMLYEYILASNGVFLHARRTGLEVMLQVAAPWSPALCVRGLQPAQAVIECDYPKVPLNLTRRMLELSREARDGDGHTVEKLFHLVWLETESRWLLVVPEQEQTATSVKPVGQSTGPGSSYDRAFIEVHSHHNMSAFFSGTDDKDEQGFRIYGVFGTIFNRPIMRLRIGVYGQFWEVPANDFFDLGEEIQDAYFDDDRNAKNSELVEVEEEMEAVSQ